jgi:putative transposase
MILTYKYRLKDRRAKTTLSRCAIAVNQVWNFCVETHRKIQRIRKQGPFVFWPNHIDLKNLAAGTSKELGIHAQSVQSTCRRFVIGRDKHKKCPRFRASSGPRRALGWIPFQEQSRQIEGNRITYLGKQYRFFGAEQRPIPSSAKGGCFVEDAQGRWWVCFHVEVEENLTTGAGEVGIDLGLKNLATTSSGEQINNPQSYKTLETKLATSQRARNSKRVKSIHSKIKNVRRDHLHKVSCKLANANRLIVVGNVSSSKLAKTRMAKSVLDAGWSILKNMLEYKASRHQAIFKVVDERFTTQTCSTCGSLPESRPQGIAGLGVREWVCSSCGANHDRDVNAAKNILRLGQSALPLAEESRKAA